MALVSVRGRKAHWGEMGWAFILLDWNLGFLTDPLYVFLHPQPSKFLFSLLRIEQDDPCLQSFQGILKGGSLCAECYIRFLLGGLQCYAYDMF